MTSKTTFKGFTFKKSTGLFVPPPPASAARLNEKRPTLNSTNNGGLGKLWQPSTALGCSSDTADKSVPAKKPRLSTKSATTAHNVANTSVLAQPSSGFLEHATARVVTETLKCAAPARPVATVTPQGHSMSTCQPTVQVSSTPCSPASVPVARIQGKSSDLATVQKSLPVLQDLQQENDDDDFDLPAITSVTPKRKHLSSLHTSDKKKQDSDDDILQNWKRRTKVLSDDEDDPNLFSGELNSVSPDRSADLMTSPSSPKSEHPLQTQGFHSVRHANYKVAVKNTSSSECSPVSKLRISLAGHSVPSDKMSPLCIKSSPPACLTLSGCPGDRSAIQVNSSVPSPAADRRQPDEALWSRLPTSAVSERIVAAVEKCWANFGSGMDLIKHPHELSKLNLQQLQWLWLRAADEVCDIISSASTASLMNLQVDYGRLQTLLAMRKQFKDKANRSAMPSTSSGQPQNAEISSSSSVMANQTSKSEPQNSNNCLLKTSPVAFNTAVKKISITNVLPLTESPVPCGDSFFEDTNAFPQSHMAFMQSFTSPTNLSSHLQNSFSGQFYQNEGAIRSTESVDLSLIHNTADRYVNLHDSGERSSKLLRSTSGESTQTVSSIAEKGETDWHMSVSHNPGLEKWSAKRSVIPVTKVSDGQKSHVTDFEDDDILFEFKENEDYTVSLGTAKTSSASVKESVSVMDPYTPFFASSDKDDGATGEFDGEHFKHSKEMRTLFHNIFGLREFRHNQLQAINAALLGNDCFILMPTGGGKSLCYQLPALVTQGISVIISPLRALIQDQVQRLVAFDIPAAHLSADLDNNQTNNVYASLYQRQPGIKLLYVTPEKISASEKLLNCLHSLYGRQMLDRFVIDEAHCVSQWGHDFRPDYKKLNILRSKFPGVPIMALTATATPRVRRDILHQLGMQHPKWFMQSFNRPNLKYTIRPKKPSNTTTDIIEIIKSRFKKECGIVYCLSRKECDNVADDMKKAGIEAAAYHAGLSDSERIQVQDRWLNGDNCKVICATIAFGMGIDKADVRFVIHYSLPKSVEGFYQEAGRAGRDSMIAHCILFYTYSDVKRLRRILDMDPNASYESKRVHIDNLFRMVQYCENLADCRRAQILHYFGEQHFDRERCNIVPGAICDNCSCKDMFKVRDVTEDAKEVVKCVRDLTSKPGVNFTLLHFVEIFKGSQNTRIMEAGHNRLALHGRGAAYSRSDAERLMHKLVIEGVLIEELKITAADTTACYIRIGPKAASLMQNKMKIELAVQGGSKQNERKRIGQEPQTSRQQLVEDCYKELVTLAKTITTEHGSKNYALIFPNAMLWQLAEKTPVTVEEMKQQIDGLPETKINKYGAHRFLAITSKYCIMLASIADNLPEDKSSENVADWASPYFDASTTRFGDRKKISSQQKTTQSRGGKKTRGWRKKNNGGNRGTGGGHRGNLRSSRGRGSTQDQGSTSTQGTIRASRGRGSTQGRGSKSTQGASAVTKGRLSDERSRPVIPSTKSTLGLMPDPRARPYLASIGSYMG